tara:strand:+ start:5754 stop:7061 length:1308 start_codon:yes stop_codon:yes gene_type:complete
VYDSLISTVEDIDEPSGPVIPPCNTECALELVEDNFDTIPGVSQNRNIYAQGSKIIVSARQSVSGTSEIKSTRFNADGSIDLTFGTAGVLNTDPLISTTLSPTATSTGITVVDLIIELDTIWVFFNLQLFVGVSSSNISTMLAKYTIDGQHVPWGDPIEGFAHDFDPNLDWKGFGGFRTYGGVHHLNDGRFISFDDDVLYILSADGLTFSQQIITHPSLTSINIEDSFAGDFITIMGEVDIPAQSQDLLIGVIKMDLNFVLDPSYGDGGLALFDINVHPSPPTGWTFGIYGVSMNLSSDGSAYVFGWLPLNNWNNGLTAGIKFLPDGQLDETFGDGGIWVDDVTVLADWSEPAFGYPPYINCDDQIVLCYTVYGSVQETGVVAKISPSGETLSLFELTERSYLLGPVILDNQQIGILNSLSVPGIITLECDFVNQ